MFSKNRIDNAKGFSSIYVLFLAFSIFITIGECLYEDQVGKFDWTSNYVGQVTRGYLDDRNGQVYVATQENVVAALNSENGEIVWRKILEKTERGKINALMFLNDDNNNPNSVRLGNGREDEGSLISVSGDLFSIVRGWNIHTGHVTFEWTTQNEKNNAAAHWFDRNSLLYQVIPAWDNSAVTVYEYNTKTGHANTANTRKISLKTNLAKNCDFVDSFLICTSNNEVSSINLLTGASEGIGRGSIRHQLLSKNEPLVLVDGKVHNILLKTSTPQSISGNDILYVVKESNKQVLLSANSQNSNLLVKAINIEDKSEISSFNVQLVDHLSRPEVSDAGIRRNKRGDLIFRILWTTEDGALILSQSSKVKWIREESLADIVALEMIDLPLSDSEGAIEKQLKTKTGDILGNFVQRIRTQLNHVQHLLQTIFDVVKTHHMPEEKELTRDAFGLHTIIVAVTSTGKIFGIDNISGKHHYAKYLPNISEFDNEQKIKLIVQRTSKHFPNPAQVVVLAKNKVTENSILYAFNPITGDDINGGLKDLDFALRQITLLQPGADHLRGILLLDKTNNVHVFPENAAVKAHGTYIYTANKENGIVTGYFVELQNNKELNAVEIWRINLSGFDNSQKITQISAKNPNEHVHSQGRVLNDRSVLYKYINPNLVAIVTQGADNIYKYVLNVHLVDVVSGSVVSTINHRRVRGPVNIVHSENWLVYTYYNDKVRRTELTAIELFEGNTQANSTIWTSFDAPPLPAVEQQSYIIPSNVVAMKETITEKGITHKHVLIGLSTGGVIEMPWHLLDPRRPILGLSQPREEGTIPYMPELPLSSESIINYNKSISHLHGIYTAPSGLESTCLVVAYGLDMFVTRVAPSKTYDLLKEDFDYFLITSVLVGLIAASIIVKQMSAKKSLKQAWK